MQKHRYKMRGRKLKGYLKNNLLSLSVFIILMISGIVLANNVIVNEGNFKVEGNLTVDGATNIIPSGAIMHFNLTSCPTGWSELTSARGRYIVGLNNNGTLGAATGTALNNSENRAVGQHNHFIMAASTSSGATALTSSNQLSRALDYGPAPSFNYGGDIAGTSTAASLGLTSNSGSVAGTNAPYIQFLVCQKN